VIDEVLIELDPGTQHKPQEEIKVEAASDLARDHPRLAKLDPKWTRLGYDGEGIGSDRSKAVFAFTCACIRAGIADDVIAACLMHWKVGEHIRDQSNVPRALNRVITRAHLFVKDSKLFEMNEKHCVLPIGSKTRVATWGEEPDFPGRITIVRFSPISDFTALYDKYRYTFKGQGKKGNKVDITMGLGSWWIDQHDRRQYDGGMRFAPTVADEVINGDTLNLWMGFAVAPRKPDGKSAAAGCSLFLEHGLKIICSGDEEHYDYLIKREAFIAQRRTRSEVAVGLRTEAEGTGKGRWETTLNHLYGAHAMQLHKAEHVIGKHNKHLEVLLRVTADEALFVGDPRHRNALFGLITEPELTIEPKFIDAYRAKSHINIDLTSNAEHFLPVSATARRFMVPTVSSKRAGDHEYFRKMDEQLHDGGYEALLYHLLCEVDIRDFNVRAVPKTAMLQEQASHSRKGVDLLVETACNTAQVPCPCWEEGHAGLSVCSGYEGRLGFDYFIDHHSDRELAHAGALKVKRILSKEDARAL
jgi:hypothetical protein